MKSVMTAELWRREALSIQFAAKRNELGVQLLSRRLHEQVFGNVVFPARDKSFVQIAQDHLQTHGLDPSQGSVLPDLGFTLPQLQGRNPDEHFHRIGAVSAHPWLSLAKTLSASELPPKPDFWHIQAGWTKYHYLSDGSSYTTHVEFPQHDGRAEDMLVFDVETMPEQHPFAVMACAASRHSWYSWVSPWLLNETSDPQQLISLGDASLSKVVVGHNVSYDRARILEEYSVSGTQTRFLDTMALHVAVKGISSHQRPAWNKYRKQKIQAQAQKDEAVDTILDLMRETEQLEEEETDADQKERLRALRQEMEDSLPQLQAEDSLETEAELSSKRWEDLTSANSLADVAKLHCGIVMDKEIRNDFMTHSSAEILDGIQDYLTYCANDVAVTHAVFSKVLPAFLTACPSPVSFAGILTMGSSFLPVNEEWEAYLANAEKTYQNLNDKIKNRLIDLAHAAKTLMEGDAWKDDVWLSQLDWTPKVAGKSRGVGIQVSDGVVGETAPIDVQEGPVVHQPHIPAWYRDFRKHGPQSAPVLNRILPLLLCATFDGHPMRYTVADKWHYLLDGNIQRLPTSGDKKILTLFSSAHGVPSLTNERLQCSSMDLALSVSQGIFTDDILEEIKTIAARTAEMDPNEAALNPSLKQLDWTPKKDAGLPGSRQLERVAEVKVNPKVYWPKWYWELAKPKKDMPPGSLDLTVRNRIAPILLKLSWQGWPLFHSREHGWTYRVPPNAEHKTRAPSLVFYDPADDGLAQSVLRSGYLFYKLPHKDGEKANVGSPLSKTFIKYAQDGTLTSPGDEAKDALDMNAQCSYWISARDRVMKQLVVWQDQRVNAGFLPSSQSSDSQSSSSKKWGIIIPQVITMGTVTRRAIEKTWLTASNAKKNRVGSELKAMVRAPEGYAIVGADVDSEELWISSVMGDAQFGIHGATAIGWMTLEGTKAAGTDLHSKTASILGISRDQAKVFNYSRIYGAGMRHAVLLLLQANAGMLPEQATKLAQNLYASTKGKNTHRGDIFGRKFWFGGTESFVFNKLEEIALSDSPQTPALGCGVTHALSKEYLPAEFGSDYMTSRINWVVQSSGVDYLHLLIVAMNYLISKYNIEARYLISVHDELRYLVKEEDKYRAALALQIANLWTRSLFAFKLGLDDLPQGVAFFSAVDVDTVLRKEVDMPCTTPSQLHPIPPGESLDLAKVLDKTSGGSLWADGSPMEEEEGRSIEGPPEGYQEPNCLTHRASSAAWLRAQATSDFAEIKHLAQQSMGEKVVGGIGAQRGGKRTRKRPLGSGGSDVDWSARVEEVLKAKAHV
ncbi:DNA-directed DNA polymerase gamma mip1 [Steccherinum ochraceum]|uniref:Mitochondrial DNA polymerase catalytic subunit n=1 Tax=Steccherinum ochraceum TaxID=92696 RepID=A0A4R0RLV8_9APHY|nr:DNA-directed DNA polymerase gamma mip1 [Steccherinum ochraceum]